jgi:ABC-2 type transport system permease protein
MKLSHALLALQAVTSREVAKFVRQGGRLASALVRPLLWLVVFAAGFQNVFGVSIIPPYDTYIPYQTYIVPGLLGMVLLFNGMQSSLAMVYDREMGVMRLLLTAPLPRAYLLFAKLLAGTLLSVLQAYVFLAIAALFDVGVPWSGWLYALPVLVLYPLWKLEESGASVIHFIASWNPFSHAVEATRFALYGQWAPQSLAIVVACLAVFFLLAAWGYDPQRGIVKRAGKPGGAG